MDLDKDGVLDVLSGSYATSTKYNAKRTPVHFYKGKANTGLEYSDSVPVKTLSGDALSLKTLMEEKNSRGRKLFYEPDPTSTKPCFTDLNDDGYLDLIYGEYRGYLVKHAGSSDKGINHFSDTAEILKDESGENLTPGLYSSPHFVDWDGDGDLDIVSGQVSGGVYYAQNIGNSKQAKWKAFVEWQSRIPKASGFLGRDKIQDPRKKLKPWAYTTVCVTDYNNDGKLDLIVGDMTLLEGPAEGVSDEKFDGKYLKLRQKEDEMHAARKKSAEYQATYKKELQELRENTKTSEKMGFIWVYLQK